jgi:hypothetical protein
VIIWWHSGGVKERAHLRLLRHEAEHRDPLTELDLRREAKSESNVIRSPSEVIKVAIEVISGNHETRP